MRNNPSPRGVTLFKNLQTALSRYGWLVVLALACVPVAGADESLAGLACRSVHLGYDGQAGVAFTSEVIVERSAPGTYFCVCGFNRGYFGIQELSNGKKLVIFSVWEPSEGDDPTKVDESRRTKLLYKDPAVRSGRFGGEGTGGQSFLDYDWKVGQPYRFLVRAKVVGDRTEFAGYFFIPEENAWKHLATFSALGEGQALGGYYGFIEDFLRNKESATQERRAKYGHGWIQSAGGTWSPLLRARFTADSNPAKNINAGQVDGWFFLQTGGKTENTGTPLRGLIQDQADPGPAPVGLPVLPEAVGDQKVTPSGR